MVTVSFDEVFGAVVRIRRDRAGLDSAAMAARMKLSASTWSRMESGRTAFTPSQVVRAAKVVGCTPGDIFAAADRLAKRMKASGNFKVVWVGRPRDNAKAVKLGMVLGGTSLVLGIALSLLGESAGFGEDEET